MPRVFHRMDKSKPASAIYVGRPTMFGNPYGFLKGGSDETTLATVVVKNRAEAIDMYRQYFNARIESDPLFKSAVETLRGFDLCCWCSPQPCHADVILEYLGRT